MPLTAQALAEALGGAEKRGAEWCALCPAHDDTSPSLAITERDGKTLWVCRAGCPQEAVTAALQKQGLIPKKRASRSAVASLHPTASKSIIATYDYTDASGTVVGQVVRFHPKDFRQRKPDGKGGWVWNMAGVKLPLYRNADLLSAVKVIIVEGEKDVDSLRALGFVATTNAGGAGKWKSYHSSCLKSKEVTIIADRDEPGRKHAHQVMKSLTGVAASVTILECPEPHKDVSDWIAAGASAQGIRGVIRRAHSSPPLTSEQVEPPESTDDYAEDFADSTDPVTLDCPFRALGHDHLNLFFYSTLTRQVLHFATPAAAESCLFMLAPLHWWESNFNGLDKAGKQSARAWLAALAISAGVYDPTRIRGRGGWWDDKRIVLHCGTHIICEGQQYDLAAFKSHYTYESGVAYPLITGDVAPNFEAVRLRALCDRIRWARPIDGTLLAGWIVLAPFCGALEWRPHISITGESGSGKSWVVDNLIRATLKDVAANHLSTTTEAAIRQSLRGDARPVVLDEIEPHSKEANLRIQAILEFARAASGNDSVPISKGSPSGAVTLYYPRSMFCYSGIVEQTIHTADRNRTTILTIRAIPPSVEKTAHFTALEQAQAQIITPDWISGLRARTASLLPTIRANARVFAAAWVSGKGDTRTGNQVGTLLAGAYSLVSTKQILIGDALKYIERHDWTDEKALQEERDPVKVIQTILRHVVRINTGVFSGERNVGELIEIVVAGVMDRTPNSPSASDADGVLQRLGLRVRGDWLAVATEPAMLAPILRFTPWANGHSRILARLDGAEPLGHNIRFSGGPSCKVTTIPLKSIMSQEDTSYS